MPDIDSFSHDIMEEQWEKADPRPGICIPWDERRKEIADINGDEELFKRIWEENEELAYSYIWQVLLSF